MLSGFELQNAIQDARRAAANSHNGAYFNAKLAYLAHEFRSACDTRAERIQLKESLKANVDYRMSSQATAVLRHLARVLGN